MVHGLLQDRHREFFIQRTAVEEGAGQEGSDAAGTTGDNAKQDTYDAAEWHNGFQVCLQQCLLHVSSSSLGFSYCNSKYFCTQLVPAQRLVGSFRRHGIVLNH